ncbi:MAG: HEAT repeat domain-containing protein, partial [Deltaproteobacteria bacterium]
AHGESRADELLGRALDDESSKVRTEALRTLLAWHSEDLQPALRRGAGSRHADVRRSVVDRLAKAEGEWARRLLLALVADASSDVGLAALKAITKDEAEETKSDVFLMALHSPRPEVRAAGCKGCRRAPAEDLRARLLELITEEHRDVHLAAIEAADAMFHQDVEPYRRAFASVFFELRVRAAELLGKRRDKRAVEPIKALLRIPKIAFDRPTDDLRARAARALADVGDPSVIPFYISLLDDEDGTVREMGARGLATACRPGREKPLVDALAHADMAVRSWAAEGLARLGDDRAAVVLAGTLTHDHRPIRVGAILGFVALGPDGVRGLLAGLQDPDREVADLVLAIVVARDIALARAGLVPDLLVLALSSAHPEVRFAAARALETRTDEEAIGDVARSMVGPKTPERGAKPKDLPSEEEQARLLSVVVAALASDDPEQRYAAARVLELRATPKGYWREARRLARPGGGARPHTNWEDESRTRTKKGWLRRLFARGEAKPGPVDEVLFGTYAGLVRQAPPEGEADETHRVRRDSVARLVALSSLASVGRDAVLPIVRRALSDPHHLVRRRAQTALTELYPEDPITPLLLSLDSSADDVGRTAVDLVIERALEGDAAARELAPRTLAAKSRDARAHALSRLPRLFEEGSLEPWFIALESPFADVRRLVVDRLAALPNADDHEARIRAALGRALESDHEDLRMQAARSLARRGDPRTADVFAGFLRSDDERTASRAIDGLVTLASAANEHAATAATALTGRLEDDPDATADRRAIVRALGRIGSDAASDTLFAILADEDTALGDTGWEALVAIARDTSRPSVPITDGGARLRYHDALAIRYAGVAAASIRPELRIAAATLLNAVEDADAEVTLAKLIDDRDADVRVAAAESIAFRAEHIEGASIAALERAIAAGRRELVLPAAVGLAVRGRVEAFRPLLLVLKAGLPHERQQAMLGLGVLGDDRAVDELNAFVDPSAELEEADLALVPFAAEAL